MARQKNTTPPPVLRPKGPIAFGNRTGGGAKSRIEVRFWGVRGSVATHHPKNIRFGGHTSCVSIHFDNQWLVCDAGTGIRALGQKLAKTRGPVAVFLSHLHWDHIFGLPFFKPLYQHKRKVVLAGPSYRRGTFKKLLRVIMRSPYFPIGPLQWNSHVKWLDLKGGRFALGKIFVRTKWVHHPDGALGFQFHFPGGRRIIYVADQELNLKNKKFIRWIQGADLLIHDAQYDRKEYVRRKGWGHSAYETILKVAVKAGIKKLVLFHFDPGASDSLLEKRLGVCRKYTKRLKSPLKCLLAREGSAILL